MKTKVKFLIHPNDGTDKELFAFFPEDHYNIPLYGKEMLTCYAHLGQHSACHIDYANESKEATKEQYKELQNELKSIGYKLNVLNK